MTISVKESKDTLKNFKKRIRKNYQTAKKIYDLNQKIQNRILFRFNKNSSKISKNLV